MLSDDKIIKIGETILEFICGYKSSMQIEEIGKKKNITESEIKKIKKIKNLTKFRLVSHGILNALFIALIAIGTIKIQGPQILAVSFVLPIGFALECILVPGMIGTLRDIKKIEKTKIKNYKSNNKRKSNKKDTSLHNEKYKINKVESMCEEKEDIRNIDDCSLSELKQLKEKCEKLRELNSCELSKKGRFMKKSKNIDSWELLEKDSFVKRRAR